jgi:alkyl sulfatase BDS1-like metallo-beta-lactamase superfamily hydrolase
MALDYFADKINNTMEEIKTIKQKKINDVTIVAIVLARDWFDAGYYGYPISHNDFIVGQWSDFHDGEKSNIEGKQTIATCRKLEHAELIYDSL